MKFFKYMKDGGPESCSYGWFLVEIKRLCSVVLLHFTNGSREAYHSHAFNSIAWVFKGQLTEHVMGSDQTTVYKPSFRPIFTSRDMFHKVVSTGDTWVIAFRGPWVARWKEFLPNEDRYITLTHGRRVVA